MEEWKLTKIGKICRKVCSGGTPKSTVDEYYGGGIPWLNTKEVNFNRIYSTESTITETGLQNSSAKWIDKHAVIIAMYGATAAKCAIVMIPMTTNQACCNLMIDEKQADYRFVYYSIANAYSKLASLANGGAQQNLNAQLIKDFEIPLPSIFTQRKIANILTAIDDKIELNNRINHNLEQTADEILIDAIHNHTIKKDSLNSICCYVKDRVDCGILDNEKYVSTDSMKSNKGGIELSSSVPDGKCISFIQKDVLVSNIRPYFKKIWQATNKGGCSNDVLCFRSTNNTPSVLYHLLRSDSFFDYVMTGAKGSKMPRGDKSQIMKWEVPLFKPNYLYNLEKQLSVIDNSVSLNDLENKRLTVLRDTLLPSLFNGHINC